MTSVLLEKDTAVPNVLCLLSLTIHILIHILDYEPRNIPFKYRIIVSFLAC